MRLSEIQIGSNRLWYVIFLLVGIMMLFSPTIWAGIKYLQTSYSFVCENFSLRIPLYWLVDKDAFKADCAHGFSLMRISPTTLGSADFGNMLFIERVGPNKAQDISGREQVFRMVNRDPLVVPYSLNDEFNKCLRADTQFKGRDVISMLCSDEERGIVLNFQGSPHALTEVSTMIRPR
jgi:hypothetical protein